MSSSLNAIQGMINNALMQTHTAFCAKVLSVNGSSAKIQPLNMVKAKGGEAKKQAVLNNVPILKPAYVPVVTSGDSVVNVELDIKAGDTVYCLCAERDITQTKNGVYALPVTGRHMLSSAVIIGKF